MNVMQKALEWLKAEGYVPQAEEGFVAVKYQGLTFLIPDSGDDKTFLKVDLSFPVAAFNNIEEAPALKAVNAISQDVKIVKGTYRIDQDGAKYIVFSAETLVCESDDFGVVLPRLFDLLGFAAQTLFERLSK